MSTSSAEPRRRGNSPPRRNEVSVSTPTRKIKACAACRRQKVKCHMDDRGSPCRRCAKHRLQCFVSKNLQTILDEKTRYTDAILEDLENTHIVLRELVKRAGLPEPKVLQTTALRRSLQPGANRDINNYNPSECHIDDNGLSRDCSPDSVGEDSLPHAPMQSLYALTKLKSLRSPGVLDQQQGQDVNDFIGRGAISESEAGRLFTQYRDGLDAFIYNIGCCYQSLDETRRKSPILTAAILTVAALHDPQSEDTYTICNSELRRLISLTMFDRRVSRDYLRAMCVASYWLSELSWRISGHTIRLASECELHDQHRQAVNSQSPDAADGARLWFILRVCDQRLATLYGRPAIVHEDLSINEVQSFLQSPVSNHQDQRLLGQIALLDIFKSIRELFGSDRDKPIPRAYLHQLAHFNNQLDIWHRHWAESVSEHYEHIGVFPRKALHLHCQFAKLHLNSHVFRGLPAGQPIPHYFLDSAAAAISAATSTINFILSDPDVAALVVGMPSYLHCMTAFACTFLVKVDLKYGNDLIEPDPDYVWNLTTSLVQHFRSVPAGKWHLTKLMAPGLERMAAMLDPRKRAPLRSLVQGFPDIDGQFFSVDQNADFMDRFSGVGDGYEFNYTMNVGLPPLPCVGMDPSIQEFASLC